MVQSTVTVCVLASDSVTVKGTGLPSVAEASATLSVSGTTVPRTSILTL